MNEEKNRLWNECLQVIKDNLPVEHYESWFAPITVQNYDNGVLTLRVPSAFYVEQLEGRFRNLLSLTLRRVYGNGLSQLKYSYDVVKGDNETNITEEPRKMHPVASVEMHNPFDNREYVEFDSQLNELYTFDNYCESNSNKLAYTIADAIASNPKCQTFNPMFIFGPTGVGKTHLIQAIGNKMKVVVPDSRVLYLTARTFESQYITAVRKNQVNDFINFYKSIDMLIIDDVQEFAGKTATQNTFFHIFNYLHNRQKHLILSCDCPPSELDGMEPRLLSRFKWGMTVELSRPDYELRKNVFLMKAAEACVDIPLEITEFVAENVKDNVRELEGVFVSLLAYSTALNQPFTIELAKNVLSNSIKTVKKQVTFDTIVETVCSQFSIDTNALFSKSRKREIADSRQLIMSLAKKYTKLSYTIIGAKLNRNHATVLHACKMVEERLSVDKDFRQAVAKVEDAIMA